MTPETATPPPSPAPRRDVEAWLSRVLTLGVLLAAFVAVFGGTLYITRHARDTVSLHVYQPQPPRLTSASAVASDAARLDPLAIMQLGLLLLILTPVARVACSLVLFVIKRDGLYVVITLVVLAVLLVGLVGDVG